ncbi:unnamed protein product [Hymenolepis diminuta]|uniref:Uncharacterized protein n=1 Tax=Hymenolepis diminuta TaxID=6216 RepID=A0A564ZCE7_HYMDI|nr:unnamed protein product [Hymenolepis diminuta]
MLTSARLRPYGMGISLFHRPDISAWQIISLGPYRFALFDRLQSPQFSASSTTLPLDVPSSAVRVGVWTWHFRSSPFSFPLLSCGSDRQSLLHSPLSSLPHDSRAYIDGSHSGVFSIFRPLFSQKLAIRWPFTDDALVRRWADYTLIHGTCILADTAVKVTHNNDSMPRCFPFLVHSIELTIAVILFTLTV